MRLFIFSTWWQYSDKPWDELHKDELLNISKFCMHVFFLRYIQMPRPFCFEPGNRYIIAIRFQRHGVSHRHLTAFILVDSVSKDFQGNINSRLNWFKQCERKCCFNSQTAFVGLSFTVSHLRSEPWMMSPQKLWGFPLVVGECKCLEFTTIWDPFFPQKRWEWMSWFRSNFSNFDSPPP